MFRKKKAYGQVTIVEDEPELGDQFDDLGLTERKPRDADEEDLDQLTTGELERLAITSARTGKESTARALRMANEAREMGVSTAQNMHDQTAQLEKMSEEIEVVHNYLDRSERIIDKMSKPMLARMFQKKKGGGKGLEKVRGSRKEREVREEARQNGVDALDLNRMAVKEGRESAVTMVDLEEEEEVVEAGTSKARLFRKGKDSAPVVKDAREIKEDYSQYSKDVADVMREQDGDLDQISAAVADMQSLAGAMTHELEYQDKLIHEVQDFTAETSRRTKANARKVNNIK